MGVGRRSKFQDWHPDLQESVNNLGTLLYAQGKLDESEPLLREALSSKTLNLGGNHPRTYMAMNDLGMLLRAQGRLDEAESLFREALAGSRARKELGANHLETL